MSLKQPLSPQNALRLLDLLCADDDFRTAFAADPNAAMAQHQLMPLAAVSACAIHGTLASKEEFLAARAQMVAVLASKTPFRVPFMFEDGQVSNHLPASSKQAAA